MYMYHVLLVLLRAVKGMVAPYITLAQGNAHIHFMFGGENYSVIILTVHVPWGTCAF